MQLGDQQWWPMVAGTIAALHQELNVPITPATTGAMAYQARELGWDVTKLKAWLADRPSVPTPPSPPMPASGDAVDLTKAVITRESPDVRFWPIRAHLSEVGLSASASMLLDFNRRWGPNAWPFVEGPEGGEIQYTLWVGCLIGGLWYFVGSILCISRGEHDNYVPTGGALIPGQLPRNWYYFTDSPMRDYQPQHGELVAWFLTAGAQRRTDINIVEERTQVVLTPFSEGTYQS